MQTTTRRSILRTAALGATTAIAAPYVRPANAGGRLSVGFLDHWVPGANEVMTGLCNEWAEKEKVDLQIDYITGQANKIRLTAAAEAQARSGHDILAFSNWDAAHYAGELEPADDPMREIVARSGKVYPVVEYIGCQNGSWVAVPATSMAQLTATCSRLDMLKGYAGIDLLSMYPPDGPINEQLAAEWTWDAFLAAAEKCYRAGFPFGLPLGNTGDSVVWVDPLFRAFGAQLVDEKGEVKVNSDATRAALEYARRLVQFLPSDVFAWDDASNNRWLISGKGALIFNPPSAWAVAKRDAPKVAEECWTHPMPRGPQGRFVCYVNRNWGIWGFSQNKSAARSLLVHLSTPEAIDQLVAGSHGFDIPPFKAFDDLPVWREEGPPTGTLRHYANTGDQIVSTAGAPAPLEIGVQMFGQATMPKMIARMTQGGESIDQAIAWAESELAGFLRT